MDRGRITEVLLYKIAVSCVQRMEVIVKMKKKREKKSGGGGMCTKNGSYCEKETSSQKGNDAHLRAIIQSEKNGNLNFSDA